MAEQVRRKYTAKQTEREQSQVEEVKVNHTEPSDTKADTEALLDEIEEVLEENAAEFVASYRQKGGQ